MFSQNNDEKKLDWMYKGPNSTVDREEYLLGRSVDKTLDQLNEEEKQKQQNIIAAPKNRVEHECIPPSIRDFNKVVQAEQVDLSAKLQEDPLVTIKKREEETRRQFLQNPVQLKKLQKALKAQEAKRKKKKSKESDLDAKLTQKLLGVKKKKLNKEERDLDIILMHKYEEFKHKLTEKDLEDILNGKVSDSDVSSDEKTHKSKSKKKKKRRDSSSDDDNKQQKLKRMSNRDLHRDSDSCSEDDRNKGKSSNRYESDDSDSDSHSRNKKKNYGLVNSQGTKIPLSRKHRSDKKDDKMNTPMAKAPEPTKFDRNKAKKLTDEEKERLRREMMQDAAVRDKERERNVRKYRAAEEKERKQQDYDPDFAHKQFIRSAQSSSVESRIKSNLNNIQRSSRDMNKNFSRRH